MNWLTANGIESGQRRCPVKHGNRKVMNGILWIAENGVPRRELPERYGPWQAVYARFRLWKRREIRGGLQRLGTNSWLKYWIRSAPRKSSHTGLPRGALRTLSMRSILLSEYDRQCRHGKPLSAPRPARNIRAPTARKNRKSGRHVVWRT